ncbi:Malonyl-[acyl-carrier protein] O-methyltransferase [Madurella mycetomatis]|uniref:Malonyl-[acyl-carrier protein] O-methyltransferase n=1 Tax=Madurella mycetomatis TaxID=100816 RepID=A0A175VZD7_9PEZI|nr:Malonyl-[acyl-carrier protein] O-methyltransferase [Madurella mycetomatis]
MEAQHQLGLMLLGEELSISPIGNNMRSILDLGTGTGIWAMDVADKFPDAHVIGVDISPIQPEFTPPNCSFQIDDIEEDWTWRHPFDFIFARHLAGCIRDLRGIINRSYRALKPGGYLEMHEFDYTAHCDDGTLKKDSWLARWAQLNNTAAEKIGRPTDFAPRLKQVFVEAGFEDVQATIKRCPTNDWPRDKILKEIGCFTFETLGNELESISLARFKRGLDWGYDSTVVLCAMARRDFLNRGVHAYFKFHVVSGRKPISA